MAKVRYDPEWEDEAEDGEDELNLFAKGSELLRKLWRFRLFYFVVFAFFFLIRIGIYVFGQPVYTATATVGPPNPSPISALIAGVNGGGLASNARKLLGGGGQGGNDPFQEYLQLLPSARLAGELATKDNILPVIFYKRWDQKTKQWRQPGFVSNIISGVKRMLNLPVSKYPDADLLQKYLEENFSLTQSNTGRGFAALTGPGYMTATLRFKDRRDAERILGMILLRADRMIRDEQLKDVLARISYIDSELPKITRAEERDALIETLSNQEELKVMMLADQRFASILVDMPHSSPKPTSPMGPVMALVTAVLLSLLTWILLVIFGPRSRWLGRIMRPFERIPAAQF